MIASVHMQRDMHHSALYRVSQEGRSIFWEVIVSVILSETVYMHMSYSERFPRQSYFTVQYTVHCTDEQHTMLSRVTLSKGTNIVMFPPPEDGNIQFPKRCVF
jgi:hypothetical protein